MVASMTTDTFISNSNGTMHFHTAFELLAFFFFFKWKYDKTKIGIALMGTLNRGKLNRKAKLITFNIHAIF